MDTTVVSLLLCQFVTLSLLIISEFLPLSSSPYSGIIQALLSAIQKEELKFINQENK